VKGGQAGRPAAANFGHLAGSGLHYIGSVPASDCPDLTSPPAAKRSLVDNDRFGGLTAFDTRREVYGAGRRAILTHSPELHAAQAAGFTDATLAKAGKKLDELAATLARGKTRRGEDKVTAEIEKITARPWVRRVITSALDGDQPRDLRLTWSIDPDPRAGLEEEIFGKHVLITSHDDWPVPEVIAGYRSQSEAAFSFRQLKDPHVVPSRPCTTGPSRRSAPACSPASWPCRSPISCDGAPARPDWTCPSLASNDQYQPGAVAGV
jgi:hypothetical protein